MKLNRAIAVVGSLTAAFCMAAATSTASFGIGTGIDNARGDLASATTELIDARDTLLTAAAELTAATLVATTMQTSSADRTLDADVRPALAETIESAEWISIDLAAATVDTSRATRLIDSDAVWPWEIDSLTDRVHDAIADAESAAGLGAEITGNLADASAAVEADVASWEAEQARIAAEAAAEAARVEAAAEAARAEAEAAAEAARAGERSASVSGPAAFEVYVWGSVTADNSGSHQGAVDSGGQVAVYYAPYGTVVSAHNYNDATALALNHGDLITFTGAVSGTWVVTGEATVISGGAISQLSGLGSMMIMTCYFGSTNSRVLGLTPA